jgi:multiple sugar transport system ATP-binding protein
MARILFDQVTKRFGDAVAVRDFSLEIVDGEFLVLVGPSGCGKSTTLRMLAGLDDVTSGSITIGGRRVDNVPARERDLAMVFQTYALYPHMTVSENMAFGLRLRNVSKAETRRRVQEAAGLLGIEPLLQRKPGQLSGGQRQRVALGRAIVREPAAFLLDEPLSNLDAKLRVQTRAELTKLHQRLGTTFVYVTNDQVEAMTMATRIAVMNLGVLQQVGTPQELYERPTNVFVAGFIGSPSMNFFEAEVRSEGESLLLEVGGGHRLVPPAPIARALESRAGTRVLLGIRPEHIHDPEHPPSGIVPAEVRATVELAELMGNETFLHLLVEGADVRASEAEGRLLARVDPRTRARPGEAFTVVLNLAQLHAFDLETREAIPLRE